MPAHYCSPFPLQINTLVVSTAQITLADTTPPTVTLSGLAEVRVPQFGIYTDEGATAKDDLDGELPLWKIISQGLPINTSKATTEDAPNQVCVGGGGRNCGCCDSNRVCVYIMNGAPNSSLKHPTL